MPRIIFDMATSFSARNAVSWGKFAAGLANAATERNAMPPMTAIDVRMCASSEGQPAIGYRASCHQRMTCRTRHRLDRDRRHRRTIIEIDVGHRVERVVIAFAVDVVVLHEKHGRDAGDGEDMAVGVEECRSRFVAEAYFAHRRQVLRHQWNGRAMRASASAAQSLSFGR